MGIASQVLGYRSGNTLLGSENVVGELMHWLHLSAPAENRKNRDYNISREVQHFVVNLKPTHRALGKSHHTRPSRRTVPYGFSCNLTGYPPHRVALLYRLPFGRPCAPAIVLTPISETRGWPETTCMIWIVQ